MVSPKDHADRRAWDEALADAVAAYAPDWVVCSGFMRILGAPLLERFDAPVTGLELRMLDGFDEADRERFRDYLNRARSALEVAPPREQ